MKIGDLVKVKHLNFRSNTMAIVVGYEGRGVNYDIWMVMFVDSGIKYPFPQYRLEMIKK